MNNDQSQPVFDTNEYVRPNDNWRCGGALDGLPCTRGPSATGECGAPCIPFKISERYYCNNAAKLCGRCDDGPLPNGRCSHDPPECTPINSRRGYVCNRGACEDGPLPDGTCSRKLYVCQPVRTVKTQRWLVTTAFFAAAVGLALLAIGGPGHQAAVSPGNVASVHQTVADDCSACHRVETGDVDEVVDASVSSQPASAQNELCVRCHQEFSQHNHLPHTTSAESLSTSGASLSRGDLLVETAHSMFGTPDELACADCHREHHGADNDLTAISDRQCQICHTNRFHSFTNGHPPFTEYPLSRRSEIYFDHSTHFGSHFAEFARTAPEGVAPGALDEIAKGASITCERCHETDDSGAYILTRGYQASCASCHDAQIVDAAAPAMPALSMQLPVSVKQPDFRPWGQERGPYDLPPMMQLLLAADPRFADRFAGLQTSSWQSALADSEDQTRQVQELNEAVFELLQSISDQPQQAIEERIAKVAGDRLTTEQIRHLAATTASASFVANVREIAAQLEAQRAGAAVPETNVPSDSDQTTSRGTGWSFDELTGTLRYRPREHADSLMRQWTDLAAALVSPDQFLATVTNGNDIESDIIQTAAEYFLEPIAAGRCIKCHTVDRVEGHLHVNWNANHHAVGYDALTFFRHAPHIVMLPGQDQCITCHELEPQSELFRAEFLTSGTHVNIDASAGAASGFPQISGTTACASCHHSGGASQRCTTCHHYHVRHAASGARSSGAL